MSNPIYDKKSFHISKQLFMETFITEVTKPKYEEKTPKDDILYKNYEYIVVTENFF